jgi:WD40 repeat protein
MTVLPSFTTIYRHLEADTLPMLLANLDAQGQAEAAMLAAALRTAGHVLRDNPAQLAGQLLGRLPARGDLAHLLAEARAWHGAPWLRPLALLPMPSVPPPRTILPPAGKYAAYRSTFALSSDGRSLLAAGSWAGGFGLWDVLSGRQRTHFGRHGLEIHELTLSRDEQLLTSFDVTGRLQVWDLSANQPRLTLQFERHEDGQQHALAPDGKMLLVADEMGARLNLHASDDGRLLRRFDGHPDLNDLDDYLQRWHRRSPEQPVERPPNYTAFCFTPDGNYVFAATLIGTLCLWDVATGLLLRAWPGTGQCTLAVAVTPDSRYALCGDTDGELTLWRLADGALLDRAPACAEPPPALDPARRILWRYVGGLAISGDGQTIASCAGEPALRIWRLAGSQLILRNLLPGRRISRAALDHRGTCLVGHADDYSLNIWDLSRLPARVESTTLPPALRLAAISADTCAIVMDAAPAGLRLFPPDQPAALRVYIQHRAAIQALACSPNGQWLASGDSNGSLRVWVPADGTTPVRARTNRPISGLAISNDGQSVLYWSDDEQELNLRDLRRRRRHPIALQGDYVYAADLSTDGQIIAAVIDGYLLQVWDQGGRRQRRQLEYYAEPIQRLRLTPDGSLALLGADSGDLLCWDLRDGTITAVLRGHRRLVRAIALDAAGRRALSLSDDGSIWLWDLVAGQSIATFNFDAPLLAGALSHDGWQCLLIDRAGHCYRLQLEA